MSKLYKDILYLILIELKNDEKTLVSCLSVNKTWFEIIIPILWKNPWKYLKKGKEKILLNVIISHLSDKSKYNLKRQCNNFSMNTYQKPIYNYIYFCKHLNFDVITMMINTIDEKSEIPIIKNEIFKLFINGNTKFTHLHIPYQFNYQIHLIPRAKSCFSELEFLKCNTRIDDNVLFGIIEICKSIRKLELFIEVSKNNYGFVKLIENFKNLFNVRLLTHKNPKFIDKLFHEILENSLIKHANTLQYFKITEQPITNILSSLRNLKILEMEDYNIHFFIKWRRLWNISLISLPFLQILRAKYIQIKILTSLIENTNGFLTEINIDKIFHQEINNKKIIRAIYQNCPNLKYLKLLFKISNVLELNKLLLTCQYLNGLYIIYEENSRDLFKILIKSSPIGLYKFKFDRFFSHISFNVETLKLFFDGWKGRHPMLLQFAKRKKKKYIDELIEKYKAEGIIEKFDYLCGFEDFEWREKRFN
ncbi:hypothetical protein C1645_812892 [Glomus cerebriforme]|uniref:F-box domain-containing protein n=1 Tax=Glomus cerebriforme TaxID=658196 RepID=A0A397TK23_9GLOM|nr:hypothetical protein C1645_812892 [Glomus cerebriforme]